MNGFIKIDDIDYQVAVIDGVLYLKEITKPSDTVVPLSQSALKWDYCWSLRQLVKANEGE